MLTVRILLIMTQVEEGVVVHLLPLVLPHLPGPPAAPHVLQGLSLACWPASLQRRAGSAPRGLPQMLGMCSREVLLQHLPQLPGTPSGPGGNSPPSQHPARPKFRLSLAQERGGELPIKVSRARTFPLLPAITTTPTRVQLGTTGKPLSTLSHYPALLWATLSHRVQDHADTLYPGSLIWAPTCSQTYSALSWPRIEMGEDMQVCPCRMHPMSTRIWPDLAGSLAMTLTCREFLHLCPHPRTGSGDLCTCISGVLGPRARVLRMWPHSPSATRGVTRAFLRRCLPTLKRPLLHPLRLSRW